MTFTVVWLDATLTHLARQFVPLWGTPAAGAVTTAMSRVDSRLETNAGREGESRSGNARILFEPPLVVEFEVFTEQRVAVLTKVRYIAPKF